MHIPDGGSDCLGMSASPLVSAGTRSRSEECLVVLGRHAHVESMGMAVRSDSGEVKLYTINSSCWIRYTAPK